MRFPTADTRPLRLRGFLLVVFGAVIVGLGITKTLYGLHLGFTWFAMSLSAFFWGWMAVGFGWCGIHLLREARALDYEAAFRPGPERPLRPFPGLRRRPRPPQSP